LGQPSDPVRANYEILGDTGKQFARANEAHRLLAGLAAEKPDRTYQGDLAIAYDEVGDVLVAQGDLTAALQAYRDSLAIAERLAKADRSNTQWQRDLAISHSKSASV
jgi:tetratricopeptide (TPR) repeat protein